MAKAAAQPRTENHDKLTHDLLVGAIVVAVAYVLLKYLPGLLKGQGASSLPLFGGGGGGLDSLVPFNPQQPESPFKLSASGSFGSGSVGGGKQPQPSLPTGSGQESIQDALNSGQFDATGEELLAGVFNVQQGANYDGSPLSDAQTAALTPDSLSSGGLGGLAQVDSTSLPDSFYSVRDPESTDIPAAADQYPDQGDTAAEQQADLGSYDTGGEDAGSYDGYSDSGDYGDASAEVDAADAAAQAAEDASSYEDQGGDLSFDDSADRGDY